MNLYLETIKRAEEDGFPYITYQKGQCPTIDFDSSSPWLDVEQKFQYLAKLLRNRNTKQSEDFAKATDYEIRDLLHEFLDTFGQECTTGVDSSPSTSYELPFLGVQCNSLKLSYSPQLREPFFHMYGNEHTSGLQDGSAFTLKDYDTARRLFFQLGQHHPILAFEFSHLFWERTVAHVSFPDSFTLFGPSFSSQWYPELGAFFWPFRDPNYDHMLRHIQIKACVIPTDVVDNLVRVKQLTSLFQHIASRVGNLQTLTVNLSCTHLVATSIIQRQQKIAWVRAFQQILVHQYFELNVSLEPKGLEARWPVEIRNCVLIQDTYALRVVLTPDSYAESIGMREIYTMR